MGDPFSGTICRRRPALRGLAGSTDDVGRIVEAGGEAPCAPPLIPRVEFVGGDSPVGAYVLRIAVAADLSLSFGSFKRGKSICVPAGQYLYLGSARAQQGAVSPGRRLVRHATRSGSLPPHAIRAELIARFTDVGLGDGRLLPERGKRLFWNVDYLLDRTEAEIVGVWLLRCRRRVEAELGPFFERDPATEVIEAGLGANDVPGNTHLLRVHASEDWWRSLADRLISFIH